ncbi:ExbD/TolR family protein [Prosthecobacter sp.]|jgi:biopolymer transport protein ExbD|uniref:ExbD/TolR family protein n=1 Tax=Prosthecobacter sp. TaxID=1965333 RepID=UPI003782D6B1
MGGGGGGGDGEPEFQIAPMIDVLLVLLIFFMSITSAQVLRIDKEIQLPVAADAKKKEKNMMNEAALNVRWAKGKALITFEDTKYDDVAPLVDLLTQRKNGNPKYRVVIRGDKRLPAVEIQRVMSIVAQAGIDDISFSALNKE